MTSGKHDRFLQELKPGVWIAEDKIRMPGGVILPTRMTVLRLSDGKLLVHSPIKWKEALAQELTEKGPVGSLLAPNAFHHVFLKAWQGRFPAAPTYGPRALQSKRPDIHFDRYLETDSKKPWGDDIDVEIVGGIPKVQEIVLFHRSSQTLIVSDLVFNLRNVRGRLKWFLKIMGTYHKLAISRLFRLFIKDGQAFRDSLRRILELPFQTIIMSHGEIIEGRDCDDFRKLLQSYIGD